MHGTDAAVLVPQLQALRQLITGSWDSSGLVGRA